MTPRFTLVALLEGMPISDRPKIVWSIPTNRLKPVGCKLTIQPNAEPNVPTAPLMPIEKNLHGAKLADRRNSVHV